MSSWYGEGVETLGGRHMERGEHYFYIYLASLLGQEMNRSVSKVSHALRNIGESRAGNAVEFRPSDENAGGLICYGWDTHVRQTLRMASGGCYGMPSVLDWVFA